MILAFLRSILDFCLHYWKQIALALMFIAYSMFAYNYGHKASDDAWTKKENARIAAHNSTVANVEHDSHVAGTRVDTKVAELQAALDEALSKAPKTIYVHDKTGRVVDCGGTPVEIFLGREFVQSWNILNAEGNK
jgi:Ca2+/Na+ antiporter